MVHQNAGIMPRSESNDDAASRWAGLCPAKLGLTLRTRTNIAERQSAPVRPNQMTTGGCSRIGSKVDLLTVPMPRLDSTHIMDQRLLEAILDLHFL